MHKFCIFYCFTIQSTMQNAMHEMNIKHLPMIRLYCKLFIQMLMKSNKSISVFMSHKCWCLYFICHILFLYWKLFGWDHSTRILYCSLGLMYIKFESMRINGQQHRYNENGNHLANKYIPYIQSLAEWVLLTKLWSVI